MRYRKIVPESIQVASAYQRGLCSHMMKKIISNYQETAFGVLVVGQRADGSMWCVDGQTRLKAAIKLGLPEVPCMVFESAGSGHEATAYRWLNTQRAQSRLHKFKAMLCEGDPNSVEIKTIVEQKGFRLGLDNQKQWPSIRSIAAIEAAHDAGVLGDVLDIISQSWGAQEDTAALHGLVVGGLSKFVARYGDVIDTDALIERLRRFAVSQLVASCDAVKMTGRGGREDAMCDVFVSVWNRGRRKKIGADYDASR